MVHDRDPKVGGVIFILHYHMINVNLLNFHLFTRHLNEEKKTLPTNQPKNFAASNFHESSYSFLKYSFFYLI